MQIKVTSPGNGQAVNPFSANKDLEENEKRKDFAQLHPELPLLTADGKAYEGTVGEVVEGYEHWLGLCQIDGNDHGEWFWLTYNSDALTPEEWRDQGYKIQRAYLITPNVPVTNDKDVMQNTVNEGENRADAISKMETVEDAAGKYGDGIWINLNPNNPHRDRIYDAAKTDFIAGANWHKEKAIELIERYYNNLNSWEDADPLTLINQIKSL